MVCKRGKIVNSSFWRFFSFPVLYSQGGPGSVRFRFGNGSSGSGFRFRQFLCKKGFSVLQYSLTGKDGSSSGFGSWETVLGKNGSDGSGFQFQFGSWATLHDSFTSNFGYFVPSKALCFGSVGRAICGVEKNKW